MRGRSRAARVELEVDGKRARADLRTFARDSRRELASLDGYHSKAQARWSKVSAGARAAGRGVGKGAAIGGGLAVGALGVGIGAAFGDVAALEKQLVRFGQATDMSSEEMAVFRSRLADLSRRSGIARDALLSGTAAYVALTGDAAGASEAMALFAEASNATGASMEDIAGAVAALRDGLDVKGVDALRASLSALYVQGKAGSVELKDMAQHTADLASGWSQFEGGVGTAGLVRMGAALQVVAAGGVGAAKASTALKQAMATIPRQASKFRKLGVEVFDPKTGKLRDFVAIMDDLATKNVDGETLQKLWGSIEAKLAYDQIRKNRAAFDDMVRSASDHNALSRAAAEWQESSAGRMERAWNGVKLKMAEVLTPERIDLLVAGLEKAVMFAADVVDMIEKILGFGKDSGEAVDRTSKFSSAGFGTGAALQMSAATSRGGQMMRDFALNTATPLSQDDMMRALIRGGLRNAQAQLQLQEIARQTVLGGESMGAATRKVTGGDAAVRRAVDAMNRITTNVTVKLDGAAIAKASANSPVHSTRPGGI